VNAGVDTLNPESAWNQWFIDMATSATNLFVRAAGVYTDQQQTAEAANLEKARQEMLAAPKPKIGAGLFSSITVPTGADYNLRNPTGLPLEAHPNDQLTADAAKRFLSSINPDLFLQEIVAEEDTEQPGQVDQAAFSVLQTFMFATGTANQAPENGGKKKQTISRIEKIQGVNRMMDTMNLSDADKAKLFDAFLEGDDLADSKGPGKVKGKTKMD